MENQIPRLSPEELRDRLDQPGLYIIDLRHITQWAASDRKIAGAVWENRDSVAEWAGKYPREATLVLYCA